MLALVLGMEWYMLHFGIREKYQFIPVWRITDPQAQQGKVINALPPCMTTCAMHIVHLSPILVSTHTTSMKYRSRANKFSSFRCTSLKLWASQWHKIHRTSDPQPLGPWDLGYLGPKVRGPKAQGPDIWAGFSYIAGSSLYLAGIAWYLSWID